MALCLMLGVHKLKERSIPFKRNMKHQCKITSTNLQDYNKKSTIIVAPFLLYHPFKSTSHSYALLVALGPAFNSPWAPAFTLSNLQRFSLKSSPFNYKILTTMKQNIRLKSTQLATIVFIVLTIVLILIQNLSTTIHLNSVLSASEEDIQSTVV